MKFALLFCTFAFLFCSFTLCEENQPKPVEIKPVFDALDNADKMVFYKVRNNKRVLIFETVNKKDLSDLKLSIELKPQSVSKKKCTSKGNVNKEGLKYDYSFQLFKANKEILEIEIYSGKKIGCKLWDQAGEIASLDKWYAWFDDRNVVRPRLEPGAPNNQEEYLDFRVRWLEGMPLSIRSLWLMQDQPPYKAIEINVSV